LVSNSQVACLSGHVAEPCTGSRFADRAHSINRAVSPRWRDPFYCINKHYASSRCHLNTVHFIITLVSCGTTATGMHCSTSESNLLTRVSCPASTAKFCRWWITPTRHAHVLSESWRRAAVHGRVLVAYRMGIGAAFYRGVDRRCFVWLGGECCRCCRLGHLRQQSDSCPSPSGVPPHCRATIGGLHFTQASMVRSYRQPFTARETTNSRVSGCMHTRMRAYVRECPCACACV
jgi:hypothetical protein